jgi:hypothetical protein
MKQQTENAVAAAVVEVMAYMWMDLVGRPPEPTGKRFILVLEAAAAAVLPLGPQVPSRLLKTVSWPEQSKKALRRMAMRPEWDRVDRYEKDLFPPGTKFETAEQAFERRARRRSCGSGYHRRHPGDGSSRL